MQPGPKIQLAAQLMEVEDLAAWVLAHRADDRSWRWIANRITRETDGKVTVSAERLRTLYAAQPASA